MKHKFTSLLLTITFLLTCLIATAQSPNIILILTDDQGWNGTSRQMDLNEINSKSDYYITPNINRIGMEGMTFSRGYAPAPVCSPTRNSILTGSLPSTSHFTTVTQQTSTTDFLLDVSSNTTLSTTDTILPELLKMINPNYYTAHYGKWHLKGAVDQHGFDRSDGATVNGDGNAANGLLVQTDPKKVYSITDSSIAFMEDAIAQNRPFYLQVSHFAPHLDIEISAATQSIFADSTLRSPGTLHNDPDYGAMVEDFDISLGLLLDYIDSSSIANNTYVIFMSDNGSSGVSNNSPLKRGKMFLHEGGIRVPFMVKGPNIPANTRSDVPVAGFDLYPTIIEWAGGANYQLPTSVEGTSITPTLINGTTPINRTTPMVFHSPHYTNNAAVVPVSTIIDGHYKLYVDYEAGTFQLFDLSIDLGETSDLFATLPSIGNQLRLELRDCLKNGNAQMPMLNPAHANNAGTAPDADNDGLDDSWEITELLTFAYGANDDPDGDGKDNLQEMNDGTDPYVNTVSTNSFDFRAEQISIYPNPVGDLLQVHLDNEKVNELNVDILSLDGKVLISYHSLFGKHFSLDVGGLTNGVYMIRFSDESRTFVVNKKLVKFK